MLQPLKSNSFEQFSSLLDRYAEFLIGAGKQVRREHPVRAESLFMALSTLQKERLISRLDSAISLFEEVIAAGDSLNDSRRFLWRYFVRCGGAPSSDIFGRIVDTDIVEVYSTEQIHLFQNLNFFDWVGASLETIFCQSWHQYTQRDPQVEKQIYSSAGRIITGEIRETLDPQVPWHLIEEVETELCLKFHLRLKWLSPVFLDSQLACIIAVSECRSFAPARSD
jgi:hypothetical protein